MFENEVLITSTDKEKLIGLIKEVNNILDKYPYSNGISINTVTAIGEAKSFALKTEEWISCLYTKEEK